MFMLQHLFQGRGIVMFAGGAETFPQALVSVVFIRRQLKCTLPMEIWRLEHETSPQAELEQFCTRMNVHLRVLGGDYAKRLLRLCPSPASARGQATTILMQ